MCHIGQYDVEDERVTCGDSFDYFYGYLSNEVTTPPDDYNNDFQEFLHIRNRVCDNEIHPHL